MIFFFPLGKNHHSRDTRVFERYVLLRAIVSFIYIYIWMACTFFRVELVARGSSSIETGWFSKACRRIFRIGEKGELFRSSFSQENWKL